MAETFLEQRVILTVGWLRKAGRLAAPGVCPDPDEMPPDAAMPPHEYAQAQCVLAREAVETLTNAILDMREQASDSRNIAIHKRDTLAAQAAASGKTAQELNEEAQRLAEQIRAYQQEVNQFDGLLRVLRGEADVPLPALPLFKYAAALRRLESGLIDNDAQAPRNGVEKKETGTQSEPYYFRVYHSFLRRTDRSDRIALTIALVLCFTVVAAGLYYVFNWGRIELEITPLDKGRLRVACINSTHDSILLDVPYGGGVLQNDPTTHVGILLELLDDKGEATRPVNMETLWEYKDMSARLYGPIVIGPMFAAELQVDLAAYKTDAPPAAIRLTLFRAPESRYRTYTVPLPEEFWTWTDAAQQQEQQP